MYGRATHPGDHPARRRHRRPAAGRAARTARSSAGQAEDALAHDAAGHLIYDGLLKLTFDAWGRMTRAQRAYRDGNGALATGATVAMMETDGLGRRIVKVTGDGDANSDVAGDRETTCHYYLDGHSMVAIENGSGQTLQQFVWGLAYIDELVQIAVNQDPENADSGTATEDLCERFFYSLHDTNYNTLGTTTATGLLIEHYEYTPYGRRTVYSHGWLLCDIDTYLDGGVDGQDHFVIYITANMGGAGPAAAEDLDGDGDVDYDDLDFCAYEVGARNPADDPLVLHPRLDGARGRYESSGDYALTPLPLNPFGHQGLHEEWETGYSYNRARYLVHRLGRFNGPDPLGYVTGMNAHEAVGTEPIQR